MGKFRDTFDDKFSKFRRPSMGQRPKKAFKFLSKHSENVLLVCLLVSMVVGIGMGIGLRQYDLTPRQVMYLEFPGALLMRMLKLLILPLIISSLIAGLANLDIKKSGRMGGLAVAYYMATTLLAVILGIILVVIIRPGEYEDKSNLVAETEERVVVTSDKILDLIRNVFPDNLVSAAFWQTETGYTKLPECQMNASLSQCLVAVTQETDDGNLTYWDFSVTSKPGMNILGLLTFSIVFGIVISGMEERGKPLVDFFNCMSEASMVMVGMVIWYSPIGICFLIAAKIVGMADMLAVLARLAMYMVTVVLGLTIHGFVVLPLIYFIFVRKNPFKYLVGVLQALVTAFATSSSSATLPVTIRNLENNNKIDPRVSSFVLPVGATINMDGTALYEAVAALFIAQLNGISMSFGNIVTTSVTATIASIGAAGVPSAGLVTMIIVLNAVGLPDTDVAYILAVDWLLDRCRTAINVLGDSYGAGIVHHHSGLDKMEDEKDYGSEEANEMPTKIVENGNRDSDDITAM